MLHFIQSNHCSIRQLQLPCSNFSRFSCRNIHFQAENKSFTFPTVCSASNHRNTYIPKKTNSKWLHPSARCSVPYPKRTKRKKNTRMAEDIVYTPPSTLHTPKPISNLYPLPTAAALPLQVLSHTFDPEPFPCGHGGNEARSCSFITPLLLMLGWWCAAPLSCWPPADDDDGDATCYDVVRPVVVLPWKRERDGDDGPFLRPFVRCLGLVPKIFLRLTPRESTCLVHDRFGKISKRFPSVLLLGVGTRSTFSATRLVD